MKGAGHLFAAAASSITIDAFLSDRQSWLGELEMLVGRYSNVGISSDLAPMTIAERWGLYLNLKRRREHES